MRFPYRIHFIFCLLASGYFAGAQDSLKPVTVTGLVLAAQSYMPMERVSVVVEGSNYGTMTDASGRFQLVATTTSVLRITHISYQTVLVDIPADAMTDHAIVILMKEDSAHQLDPVTVSGRNGKNFTRDFLNMRTADSLGITARKNISKEKRNVLVYTTPTSGSEAYSLVRRQREERAAATSRVPYIKFLDIFTWLPLLKEKKKKKRARIKTVDP